MTDWLSESDQEGVKNTEKNKLLEVCTPDDSQGSL